ncbi:hypothetical protein CPB86DRAFT_214916 [Serendipita vermifera]|nr:hypothetical protein CPB86DRAFT_214916 [Serendipita vermifera]
MSPQSVVAHPQTVTNNRQQFNERLQKYQLSAHFQYKCSGPAHAQMWKCFCRVGSYLTGRSDWHSNTEAAREEAAGKSLAWFNLNGYP